MTARPSPRDDHSASDVRNSQQSSDMVERIVMALDQVASDWLPQADQEKYAKAALEASHHAELLEIVRLVASERDSEPLTAKATVHQARRERARRLLSKIGGGQ